MVFSVPLRAIVNTFSKGVEVLDVRIDSMVEIVIALYLIFVSVLTRGIIMVVVPITLRAGAGSDGASGAAQGRCTCSTVTCQRYAYKFLIKQINPKKQTTSFFCERKTSQGINVKRDPPTQY